MSLSTTRSRPQFTAERQTHRPSQSRRNGGTVGVSPPLLTARPAKTASDDHRERRAKERPDRASDTDRQPKYGLEHAPAAIAHLSGLLATLNRDEDDGERDDLLEEEIDEPTAETAKRPKGGIPWLGLLFHN